MISFESILRSVKSVFYLYDQVVPSKLGVLLSKQPVCSVLCAEEGNSNTVAEVTENNNAATNIISCCVCVWTVIIVIKKMKVSRVLAGKKSRNNLNSDDDNNIPYKYNSEQYIQ